MLPGAFQPYALAGRIAGREIERADRTHVLLDQDVHILDPVRRGLEAQDRLGGDGREEPRRDHRLAEIVDLPPVIELAPAEAGQHADMALVKGEIALRVEAAEAGQRPGRDRQGIVADMSVGIEHDVPEAELGEGIAHLRQAQQHVRLRRLDVGGADRVTGGQRQEGPRHAWRIGVRTCNVDRAEIVAAAGGDGDGDAQPPRLALQLLDRRGRRRVIIALGAEQANDHRLVFLGPRRDHRAVDRFALGIVKRGEIAEVALKPGLLHPLDDESVAHALHRLALRVGGRGLRADRLGAEIGERRQRLGQSRVAERRILHRAGDGREGRRGWIDWRQRVVKAGIQRRQRVVELIVGNDRLVVPLRGRARWRRGRDEGRRFPPGGRGRALRARGDRRRKDTARNRDCQDPRFFQ